MRVAYQSGSALDAHFDEIVNVRFPINIADTCANIRTSLFVRFTRSEIHFVCDYCAKVNNRNLIIIYYDILHFSCRLL